MSDKEKREVIEKLMAYMREKRSLNITELTAFYRECEIGKGVFKMKYVEESAALGFSIERKNNTPVLIVFNPPAGGAHTGLPATQSTATTSAVAVPAPAPVPVPAPVPAPAPRPGPAPAAPAAPAVSVSRQLQLLRQLKEYMQSKQLTEMNVGELAPFYTLYKVPKGEFSTYYISSFPDVGLSLIKGHGTGSVIVLNRPAPLAQSRATDAPAASPLAALSVDLFPEDLLPEAQLVRQLREFML
eukprot:gene19996-14571_t